tara:strand:- start:1808 stop:2506 length:699 start_codon:yes stop_codon:yes gene_type:complete
VLKILDPRELDLIAYDEGYLDEIKKFSLLEGNRIGWNYPLDYIWVLKEVKELIGNGQRILDIGCGPGAIHGYLESKYDVDIVGVDINRWKKDYVDLVGDFGDLEFRRINKFDAESVDIVISTSAFEHINPARHQEIIRIIKECLKPGGYLISTTTISPKKTRKVYTDQWDLSQEELEIVYGEKLVGGNYKQIKPFYQNHREMPALYKERFGRWLPWYPKYLSIGYSYRKDIK